jgi:DNA-binding MarR family transcriptional regulator
MARTTPPASTVEAVRALARLARLIERSTSGGTPTNKAVAGGADLSLAHYRVLAAVAAGHDRASRMAARLALGKPTISAAVDALCQRGLLSRESVAGDQRATALRVTPAGTKALTGVEESMVERFGVALARTPDPARVVESLNWLGAALDELAEERLAARVAPR